MQRPLNTLIIVELFILVALLLLASRHLPHHPARAIPVTAAFAATCSPPARATFLPASSQ